MLKDENQLDSSVQKMIAEQIKANECIHGWEQVPTNDLVVFLSNKDLEQATLPVSQKLGLMLGRGRTLVFARQDGIWDLIGSGFWGGGVERLRQYFSCMANEDSNPQWRVGIEICDMWTRLYLSGLTQVKVDEILSRLNAEPHPGPVWLDLREQFIHWVLNRGFNA